MAIFEEFMGFILKTHADIERVVGTHKPNLSSSQNEQFSYVKDTFQMLTYLKKDFTGMVHSANMLKLLADKKFVAKDVVSYELVKALSALCLNIEGQKKAISLHLEKLGHTNEAIESFKANLERFLSKKEEFQEEISNYEHTKLAPVPPEEMKPAEHKANKEAEEHNPLRVRLNKEVEQLRTSLREQAQEIMRKQLQLDRNQEAQANLKRELGQEMKEPDTLDPDKRRAYWISLKAIISGDATRIGPLVQLSAHFQNPNKTKTGSIDFDFIASTLSDSSFNEQLLAHVIPNTNNKTLRDFCAAQNSGFVGIKKQSSEEYSKALSALNQFLGDELKKAQATKGQMLQGIDSQIERIRLAKTNESLQREVDLLKESQEANTNSLSPLQKISELYADIETISSVDFQEKLTAIKTEVGDNESYSRYLKDIENIYKTQNLNKVYNKFDTLLKQESQNVLDLELKEDKETLEVLARIIALDKEIREKVMQGELGEKEKSQLCAQNEALQKKVIETIVSRTAVYEKELASCENPTSRNVEHNYPRVQKAIAQLKPFYALLKDEHQALPEEIKGGKVEKERYLNQMNERYLTTRKAARSSLVEPWIKALDSYTEKFPVLQSLQTKLREYASQEEPNETAMEDVFNDMNAILQSTLKPSKDSDAPKVQTMLNKIIVDFLNYDNVEIDPQALITRLNDLQKSNKPLYTAASKLYAQIEDMNKYGKKLSPKNKDEAQACYNLLALAHDLSIFIMKPHPTEKDWKRLQQGVDARIASEELSMSEHRAKWKQIAFSFITLGGYALYKSWKTSGYPTLFTTTRQDKLHELKKVAKTELDSIEDALHLKDNKSR